MELIHLQDTDGFDSAPETLFSDNEKNREGYLCALCPNASSGQEQQVSRLCLPLNLNMILDSTYVILCDFPDSFLP